MNLLHSWLLRSSIGCNFNNNKGNIFYSKPKYLGIKGTSIFDSRWLFSCSPSISCPLVPASPVSYAQDWPPYMGFPGGASGKESICPCRRHKRCSFDPLGQEDPLEEDMATHSNILAWRTPWTAKQATTIHRITKSQSKLSVCVLVHASAHMHVHTHTHTHLLHTRPRPQLVIVLIKGVVRGVPSTGLPGNWWAHLQSIPLPLGSKPTSHHVLPNLQSTALTGVSRQGLAADM